MLGLHCHERAFPRGEWGLLIEVASLVAGFSIVVPGLSCSEACGSSRTRDRTSIPGMARRILKCWTIGEAPILLLEGKGNKRGSPLRPFLENLFVWASRK